MSNEATMTYTIKDCLKEDEKINIFECTERVGASAHRHEFIELVYIRDGGGVHSVNAMDYDVAAGDLLFINCNQSHAFKADGTMKYVNILFTPGFMSRELMNSENIYELFSFVLSSEFDANVNNAKPITCFRGKSFLETEALVSNMLYEYNQKEAGYKSILKGYLQVLFGMILRNIKRQDNAHQLSKIAPEVFNYIDLNCFEKINLSELAEKSFYNPAYFSRIFKQTCGVNLTTYIQQKRLAEACRLLSATDKTISEISETVGYSDQKQFYKLFRQRVCCTPSEYRKQTLQKCKKQP